MRRLAATSAALLLVGGLAACSSGAEDAGTETTIEVQAADASCELSTTTAPAGDVVFTVANTGSKTTEFYVYSADGTSVVGEVENIGPGLTRDLASTLAAGTYVTACKPGMTGDGIRGQFTVTG